MTIALSPEHPLGAFDRTLNGHSPRQPTSSCCLSLRTDGVDTRAWMIAYDKVTIGGVLPRLEARGLIERSVSAIDRRSRDLHITPQGVQIPEQISGPVLSAQEDMLRGFSQTETNTLMRLLRKAMDAGNALRREPLRLTEVSS